MNNGIPNGTHVHSFAKAGSTLYAGTMLDGVYKSTNFGSNWTPTGTGPHHVHSMVSFGTNIMATAAYDGVYLSTDNGTSWTLENAGATTPPWPVWTLEISGQDIYVGDGGTWALGWVYKRPINDFTTGINEIATDDLFIIYPNPVNNGSFTIELQSNNISQKVQISICDMLGKKVYKNEFEGNSYQVKTNNMEDGIYLVKLTDGDKKSFKKIIIASK